MYTGSSTTTYQTPVDNYIKWDNGKMMDTGQTHIKEACGLRGSLANPKIMHTCRIGRSNVWTMYTCSYNFYGPILPEETYM